MKKITKTNIAIIITIVFLLIQSTLTFGLPNVTTQQSDPRPLGSEYEGLLKIYIVEIESRWDMENGVPYKYAFFDYAFNQDIEINYLDTYQDNITWNGDVEEDNVMIIAGLFNPESHRKYADPPIGRPFDAYYLDAAAGVHPGETESSAQTDTFTHTVICEVGTATWCPSCPGMANTLKSIYEQGNYPFYFIEMVTDVNGYADQRMNEYNLKYLPTGFYDGGYDLIIGGGATAEEHKDIIEDAGARDVHDLDFTLSAEWAGEGTINISISITNNEELPNRTPDQPLINGPKKGNPGVEQTFEISAIDPDEDDIYLKIDWADGTVTDWLGPYESNVPIPFNHTWEDTGNFIVKAKAKDPDGAETDWTWYTITMPKNRLSHFPLLEWILSHFLHLETLPF